MNDHDETNRVRVPRRQRVKKPATLAACAAGLLVATACSATDSTSGGETDYEAIADGIAEYAESIMDDAHVPAVAIGIITKDGIAEQRFLGENHNGDPVTAETLFEIGSSTKAFLGVTEAILVDQGELAWDDRVIDHHPEFEMHDSWVTQEFRINDLISQRSGMAEYAAETPYNLGFTWADNVKALKYQKPETSFRSTFAYQNIPHYVAGEIVAEKVGAGSWNDAVEEMLLEPLGMTSSGTARDWLTTSENTTRGHSIDADQPHELPLIDFPNNAHGAGSIISNLDDMAKWIGLHLNEGEVDGTTVVSAEQLQRTYAPLVPVTDEYFLDLVGMGTEPAQISYATGWFVHAMPEGRVIEHGGNTIGYNAAVMFDPDREVGLVILTNQGTNGGAATPMGKYGMDLIQGREPLSYFAKPDSDATAVEEVDAGVERALQAFEGVYEHELLGTFEIRVDGDGLQTRVGPDAHDATLTRESGDRFTLEWHSDPEESPRGGSVTFEGESESPDGFTIEAMWVEREE